MKRLVGTAIFVLVIWAAVASADGGGGAPGVSVGAPGLLGPKGAIRYATVPVGSNTLFESVRVHDGQVLRWKLLRGSYGIPLVAYDGSTGGLARQGLRIVLASLPTGSPVVTRFVALDRKTFRVKTRVALRGNFAFDALSPGGSLMYLIQYLGVPNANGGQRYAVRAFNLNTKRLYPGAIVDRREPDEKMTGIPLRRAESPDASWAYTLYQRSAKSPFVHALDTVHRRAFCVDLPWRPTASWLGRVTLRVVPGRLLLRDGRRTRATVDTKTFEVRRGSG